MGNFDYLMTWFTWTAEPNLIFVLLLSGAILLYMEFSGFGWGIFAVGGAVCLLLSLIGLTLVPFNWVGLAILVVAQGLAFYELNDPANGMYMMAGAVAAGLGGFMLFGDSFMPFTSAESDPVSLVWLIGAMVIFVAFSVGIFYFTKKAKKLSFASRSLRLVGEVGVVRTPLTPTGTVQVDNELWSARADDGEHVEADESVMVSYVDGLYVHVMRADELSDRRIQ